MSGRILVVDDILANRRLLQAKLEARYFEVIMAADGPSALKMAAEHSPDVILLDVMMPGMDGYEVCRRLKANPDTAFIPVVMVTALNQQENRLEGLKAGADDFMTKPFNDFGLMTRIGALMRYHAVATELRQRDGAGAQMGCETEAETETMGRPSRVVVVDENTRRARRISEHLRGAGHITASLQDMGNDVHSRGIDVLILALDQQGFDPLRLCAQFKIGERTRSVAMLLICDETNQDLAMKALELGASDIIMSPVDRQELLARVGTQTRRTRYIELLRRRVDRGIELSIIDPLTGLYNRRYMMNQLTQLASRSAVDSGSVSVAAFDIDHFKAVNDTHGHDAGDVILKDFAERLRENVRPMDIVCRQGGEEFLVIMPDVTGDLACMAAERIRCAVAGRPFSVCGDLALDITVSAGVATNEGRSADTQLLLRQADEALYAAKKSGRNRVMSLAA
ncbi:MAG: PleD family two-component system response regulator [Hyphomonadaceae bacterium]